MHGRTANYPQPTLPCRTRQPILVASFMQPLDPVVLRPALTAMTELLTGCGLGFAATKAGLLDESTTRALARVVFGIFLPAMLSTSVASTISSGTGLRALLPIPFAAMVQVALGLGIARICLLVLRIQAKSPAGREVSVLSAFGNSGV